MLGYVVQADSDGARGIRTKFLDSYVLGGCFRLRLPKWLSHVLAPPRIKPPAFCFVEQTSTLHTPTTNPPPSTSSLPLRLSSLQHQKYLSPSTLQQLTPAIMQIFVKTRKYFTSRLQLTLTASVARPPHPTLHRTDFPGHSHWQDHHP